VNQAEQLRQFIRQRKERELQILVRIEADALVITHRWQNEPIRRDREVNHANV
jgi:hypothetical protein